MKRVIYSAAFLITLAIIPAAAQANQAVPRSAERLSWVEPASGQHHDYSGVYDLQNGEKLEISGRAVYLHRNGYRFFAPDGPYAATNGLTYVSESSLLLRVEGPEISYPGRR